MHLASRRNLAFGGRIKSGHQRMAGSVRIRRLPASSRIPANAVAIVIHVGLEGTAIDSHRREGSRTIPRRVLDWSRISEAYAIKLARGLAKVSRVRTVYVVVRQAEPRLLWSCSMRIGYENRDRTCETAQAISLGRESATPRQSSSEKRPCDSAASSALTPARSRALSCKPAAID